MKQSKTKPTLKHKRRSVKRTKSTNQGKQSASEKETTVREVPRIRAVKPEYFTHVGLYDAEVDYRLPLRSAFLGLVTCCDREGRFRWQPRRLKLYTVPYDPVDMIDVLNALIERGFIIKYEHQGQWYGAIPSFLRHQKITGFEIESILPGPPDSISFQANASSINLDVNRHYPVYEYQDENVENLESKKEKSEPDFQKKSIEMSSLETNFRCQLEGSSSKKPAQDSENPSENGEHLALKNECLDVNFYKTKIETSSDNASDLLFCASSNNQVPKKHNKNNEVSINLACTKSEDCMDNFIEKNVNSSHARGKEGKGMEGKGIERKGIEGNGSEGKGREREREEQNNIVESSIRPRFEVNPIQSIFEHWKRVMNHPQARLDPKRKKLITKALKLGYDTEQLCQAIEGCSLTPHNMGDNDRSQRFDGLHVILRDADQIDRFVRNYHCPPHPLTEADRKTQANTQALQDWMNENLQEEVVYGTQ